MMKKIVVALILLCLFPSMITATELLSEDFNLCERPDGWIVENFGGSCDWRFAPDLEKNDTGGEGCFAYAKSDNCSDQPVDTVDTADTALSTFPVDCSTITGATLSFKYYIYSGKTDTVFAAHISVDGGNSWEEIWSEKGKIQADFQTKNVNISEQADGQPDVQIRFRYTASDDWWWQLDDVVVSSNESETEKFNWLLFLPAIISKKSP
ncbi:MAG: hypothetical protein D3915_12915 [Candidatus Electrothrix sp. AU1_5]|nr:hypothetical protein [Candidatus Electrothrix gigas]